MGNKSAGIYVVTGFLGSGKTTLIKKVLEDTAGRRIGIVVNEIGEVGFDALELGKLAGKVAEVTGGSIFCSCKYETFLNLLVPIMRDNPELLFVETSGTSDPSAIVGISQALERNGLSAAFIRIVCVVDAVRYFQSLEAFDVVRRQISAGDLVYISKTDLALPGELERVVQSIEQINRSADIRQDIPNLAAPHPPATPGKVFAPWLTGCDRRQDKPQTILLRTENNIALGRLHEYLKALSPYTLRIKGIFNTKEGCFKVDCVGESVSCIPSHERRPCSEIVIVSSEWAVRERALCAWEKILAAEVTIT